MHLKDTLKSIWTDVPDTNDFAMYYAGCYVTYQDQVWCVENARNPSNVTLERVFVNNISDMLFEFGQEINNHLARCSSPNITQERTTVDSLSGDVRYFFPSFSWVSFCGFPIMLSYVTRRSVKKSSKQDTLVAKTPRGMLEGSLEGYTWSSIVTNLTLNYYQVLEETPYIDAKEALERVFSGSQEDFFIEGGDFLFFHLQKGYYEIYCKEHRVGFICPKRKKILIDSDELETNVVLKALGVDNENWD